MIQPPALLLARSCFFNLKQVLKESFQKVVLKGAYKRIETRHNASVERMYS